MVSTNLPSEFVTVLGTAGVLDAGTLASALVFVSYSAVSLSN
jgi:hypothetical protein